MKRLMMEKLIKWKNKPGRKPLLIHGARQVGKTWIMKAFGEKNFDDCVYINFEKNEHIKALFEGDLEPERILLGLSAEHGRKIEKEKTLIIFDEVQECPRALTSLKYFCEDAPEYPVVAAGSQMGIALHSGTSFPVGKTERAYLYPMTYREFLMANGQEQLSDVIESGDQELIRVFREKLIDFLRQYYFVGGMPEAVRTFSETGDFNEARRIQNELIGVYRQDFSKHAEPRLTERLNLIWDSVVSQLAKENRKYIYGQVKKGSRAKDFDIAIQWLKDCGLINVVHRVKKPGYPLKAYEELDVFKIYLVDVGLLGAMGNIDLKSIVDGNRIFTEFKGAMTEQFVLQQMKSVLGIDPFYYSAPNSRMEIDFLLQSAEGIVSVEVKAEENLKARSLRTFHDKYKPEKSVRISMSDFREQDWMTNIPLYDIEWLKEIL